MTLAGLGARVIKIEPPPSGDPYRDLGLADTGDGPNLFASLNRGKESVLLDFRLPDGAQALEHLLASSDFMVHNARPGSLSRYGLDYDSVHQRHPWLIHASISAFGDLGPDAARGGFDLIVQAESGLMSVTGSADSGSVKVGAPMLDIGAGLVTVAALLAAHLARQETGVGSEVCSSLLEFAMASFTTIASDAVATGSSPQLLGSHSASFAPYGAFTARDGDVVLAGAGNERLWHTLCDVLGLPDLPSDPRFVDNAARLRHRDELTAAINAVLRTDAAAAWLDRFDAAGIPAGQVRELLRAIGSPQVEALDILRKPGDGGDSTIPAVDPPFRIDGERPRLDGPPELGAHTRGVLEEFGVPPDLVGRLTPP
jgi:crotonobetainyl-CoA:carnitine CoA-transferase CaiB-like acyl-CoA transferase